MSIYHTLTNCEFLTGSLCLCGSLFTILCHETLWRYKTARKQKKRERIKNVSKQLLVSIMRISSSSTVVVVAIFRITC